VKQRLQNLDLYWPEKLDLDLRGCASYEERNPIGVDPIYPCDRLRKKNRISYFLPHFKVELTETFSYVNPDNMTATLLQKPRPRQWKKGMFVKLFRPPQGWLRGVVHAVGPMSIVTIKDLQGKHHKAHKDSMSLEMDNALSVEPEISHEVEVEITTTDLTVESLQAWYQCIRGLKHVAEKVDNPEVYPTPAFTSKSELVEKVRLEQEGQRIEYFNETHSDLED